jgi:hypothetical protein
MKKEWLVKTLALSIVVLFFGTSFIPVISGYEENIDDYENDDYNSLIKQAIEKRAISNNNWTVEAKLLASDGAEGDYFGLFVSIDGDTALIGAGCDDDNGINSGSAYIFIRNGTTWSQQSKLLTSDGAEGDYFGTVSIDGNTALIGAWNDDNSGSAYIFIRNGTTWSQQSKLLASDGATDDFFGWSVSIDGDTALIGAHGDDDNGVDSGSAYIFIRNGTTWSEQAKLHASDGTEGDYFSYSVSIDGDTALIGTRDDDDNGINSGSAYIFIRNGTTWSQQTKLHASDGTEGDRFGRSVSIDGDTALIGAWGDDNNGDYSGSAYIFIRNGTTWSQQAKLHASDGTEGDYFGWYVSIDGDTALIGAWGDDNNGDYSGSAYIFIRNGTTWSQQAKLHASDGTEGDYFGRSVSIDGDTPIIGAYGDDDNGDYSGSVYVFTKEIPNHPPSAPTIDGTNSGKSGVEYDFVFNSIDPDSYDVRFIINWGDGDNETTTFTSSGTDLTVSHSWATKGTYIISAKAQNEYGAESNLTTFEITIPRSKATIDFLFMRFLEKFQLLHILLQI